MSKNKAVGFIEEFKTFIMRGNVMDMAVGVIIGGAFTGIVTSLNENILSQLISLIGKVDFKQLVLVMGSGEKAPVLKYGQFITDVINFLITAFCVFIIVKMLNVINDRFSKKEEEVPAAPTTKKCPYCCSEIAIEATKCPHCISELN